MGEAIVVRAEVGGGVLGAGGEMADAEIDHDRGDMPRTFTSRLRTLEKSTGPRHRATYMAHASP
jgi:hypothetical protein